MNTKLYADSPRARLRRTRRVSLVALAGLIGGLVGLSSPRVEAAAPDSKGADYWLMFNSNYSSGELTLFISGDTATTGTVDVPGLPFSTPFTVTPGVVTSVVVDPAAMVATTDVVENLGIHVTAGAEVSVYGLNRVQYTTDAFLGLPTDILGTSYVVLGYANTGVVNGTEFGVVAPQDGTTVTITPSVTTNGHPAAVPYPVVLNKGQTYQLINEVDSSADLSGTIVTSDKPVAVFGGHVCANIPAGQVACDHVVEQLPPTETWGQTFVTMPLATRTLGDTFRVLASQANTNVSINGAPVATLGAAQFYEQIVTGPAVISSDKPILVAQYSNGSSFDGITSDPFMMLVPPYEQFLGSYVVTTPASGFSANFINVVVPNGAVGAVTLDGVPVPAGSYVAIGSSGFSGAQLPVALGSHTLSGTLPFGTFVYGFADYDSYGYPGGLSLAPVARVTSVTLAPKTATKAVNTQHCLTATVSDQNALPLEGVRVDFAVTGVNTASGFANTGASGTAQFCYTGTNAGNDSIVASVGSLNDTAAATWTGNAATTVGYMGGSAVQYSDAATLSGHLVNASTTLALPGYNLGFTLGTQTASAGPTNVSGDASTPLTVTQTPGSVSQVTVNFAGDAVNQLAPSSDTKPFAINKEDCTLAYTGDLLVNSSTSTVLSAQFGESDASPGNWNGKVVDFAVTDASLVTTHYAATTNALGQATTTVPLAANVYAVSVSFVTDAYYNACSTPADSIVTVQSAAAKITGGGWTSVSTGRTSFGFNVFSDVGGLRGQLQVRSNNGKNRFHSTSVTTFVYGANSGTWTGSGRWNGVSGYTFTISVVDNGTSGKRGDTISIVIKSPANVVVFTTGGAQVLKGGNIVVH